MNGIQPSAAMICESALEQIHAELLGGAISAKARDSKPMELNVILKNDRPKNKYVNSIDQEPNSAIQSIFLIDRFLIRHRYAGTNSLPCRAIKNMALKTLDA